MEAVIVYGPDDAVIGDAPRWLELYAQHASAMPWLIFQLAEGDDAAAVQRCVVEDRDEAGAVVGEPRRALRLRDAASVAVFREILEAEANGGR